MGGEDVAWRMAPSDCADQRAENRCTPNEPVTVEDLRELGVLHWRLDPETMLQGVDGEQSAVDKICKDMGYVNRDEVTCSPGKLPNYDEMLGKFFTEHIHEDDEIRLILDGVGYFDVRDKQDRWVRVRMVAGDLIVLPAGIYHRFTMDSSDYTKAMRLFKEVPVWTPINRPCDDNEVRKNFVEKVITNPPAAQTILGEVNDDDNFQLAHPTTYDQFVKGIMRNGLRGAARDVLVMYFTGVKNPETKKSWCPDCVTADPIVATAVHKARTLNPGRRVVFLQFDVERSSYLRNPDYPLRVHPFVELKSIPTVIVAVAKAPSDTDEPGIDVVSRTDGEASAAWVDQLPKVE